MEVAPELQELAVGLAGSAARNTAQVVWDRVNALKAANKDRETISGLEQIINDLIADKNDLTRIAQAYQSELVAQRLSSGDIRYITDTVVPLIEQLAATSSTDAAKTTQMMKLLKPLLSIETVNVLQLLGFNFRRAIGEPLTELVEKSILSRASASGDAATELAHLQLRRELAVLELAQDPDAYARFQSLTGN